MIRVALVSPIMLQETIKGSILMQQGKAHLNFHQLSRRASTEIHDSKPNLLSFEAFETDKEYVEAYFDILKTLKQSGEGDVFNEVTNRLVDVLKYNVPYGRMFEGRGVLEAYKFVESQENHTPENIKLASIMGWCAAMMMGSYSMQDDIMDREETRKGFPCWHTLNNIGLTAINDSVLIQNAVAIILNKYYLNHKNYLRIVELFRDTACKITVGQAIDISSTANGKPRFEAFTRKRYEHSAKFKASLLCYRFPISLAMFLAEKYNPQLHAKVSVIAEKIGFLLQVHNDVQDSFGLSGVVGKKSTDICNGRCTWLSVEALQRGTAFQSSLFMQHYGKDSIESEKIIHDLYRELALSEVYAELEREHVQIILKEIGSISDRISPQLFLSFITDFTKYKDGFINAL